MRFLTLMRRKRVWNKARAVMATQAYRAREMRRKMRNGIDLLEQKKLDK